MANQEKALYEFGPFRVDPVRRVLLRNDEPVALQLKTFETLLVLVRNPQRVVLKDELMKAVWPNAFVEDANLSQNIFLLRKILAASSDIEDTQHFIKTIPGRGYRFAEPVRVVVDEEPTVVEGPSLAHVLKEEKAALPSVATAASSAPEPTFRRTRAAVATILTLSFIVVAYCLRPELRSPRITGMHRITHIGTVVHNTHLTSDGPRIYFRVWHGKDRDLASVSTEGGEVAPVNMPLPEMDIDDISPNSSEFLIENLGDLGKIPDSSDLYYSLWRAPVPTGSPRPIGLRTHEATWAPDGRTLAYSLASGLFQSNLDGSNAHQIAPLPGEPFYLRWSPDGRHVRFSAGDSKSAGFYLWQADIRTQTANKLIPDLPSSARPLSGGWTPNGDYFFYTATSDGTRNIYAIREKSAAFHRTSSAPVQLTNGPFTFYLPLPSKDGRRLFVVAEQPRGELTRYDTATRQFRPFGQSLSVDQLVFSPDGQWMAYVEFPECTLVRSRPDGSERRQLTYSPLRAFNPQWSPDGSQIAFHAVNDGLGPSKIYLISPNGGVPTVATLPSDDRQTYPSWTSDGASIIFSSSDASLRHLDLRQVDLRTKQISVFPETDGLMYGQISPDGRSMAAIEKASYALLIYDIATHTSQRIAQPADYPRWSRGGEFVYFNTFYFSGPGRNGGIERWNAKTHHTETLLKYPDFLLTGVYGVTFGVTPKDEILLLKDISNRDLYSLDLDLP